MQLPRIGTASSAWWESQIFGIDLPDRLTHSRRVQPTRAAHKSLSSPSRTTKAKLPGPLGRDYNSKGQKAAPLVLALHDARADRAYWLLVGRYFEELAGFDLARSGERLSVSIPRSNVLNRKAMRSLARWKNEREAALRRS